MISPGKGLGKSLSARTASGKDRCQNNKKHQSNIFSYSLRRAHSALLSTKDLPLVLLLASFTFVNSRFIACRLFLVFLYYYRRFLLFLLLLFELLISPVPLQLLKDFPFTLLNKCLGVYIIDSGGEKDYKNRDNQARQNHRVTLA